MLPERKIYSRRIFKFFYSRFLKEESGVSMLEMLVVVLIIANLAMIAMPSFLNQADKAYNVEAETAVVSSAKTLSLLYTESPYSTGENLVESLEGENPDYNYKLKEEIDDSVLSTGPTDLTVILENSEQASVCAASKSGRVYCARTNGKQALLVANASLPAEEKSLGGDLLANLNPAALLFPESASAASTKVRSDQKISVCYADSEEEARNCLAMNLIDGLEVDPEAPPPAPEPPVNPVAPPPAVGGQDQFILMTGENVIGINSVNLNNNSYIQGGVGSNGQVQIKDSARVCGTLRYGPGTTVPVGNVAWDPGNIYTNGTGGGVCPGNAIGAGNIFYPEVIKTPDVDTDNSNGRLAGADPECCNIWQRGNVAWNAGQKVLSLNYGELSLQGARPYFLCRLIVQGGSTLRFEKSGGPIRIFFDKPENCPAGRQLIITGGAKIQNNGFYPGFFFLGSDTTPNDLRFDGGGSVFSMVLYAPKTDVVVTNGFRFDGALVGRNLEVSNGSNINGVFDGATYGIPTAPRP